MSTLFSDIIDQIGSLNNSVQESFSVLKDFLLEVQLGALSLSFILLFIIFVVLVFAVFSSPTFLYNFWQNQKKTFEKFKRGDKIPRNWIGKS